MFDIGFWEIGIIAIVALLIVGPERLPSMVRVAGQWVGRGQRLARELRAELEREAVSLEYKSVNEKFRAEDKILKGLAGDPASAVLDEKADDKADDKA